MQRAFFSLFQAFAFLPGWSKRLVLLAVDVLGAPFALILAFAVQYNDVTPCGLLGRYWLHFPFVAVASGLLSVGLGLTRF